jgi:hypothetical protein
MHEFYGLICCFRGQQVWLIAGFELFDRADWQTNPKEQK